MCHQIIQNGSTKKSPSYSKYHLGAAKRLSNGYFGKLSLASLMLPFCIYLGLIEKHASAISASPFKEGCAEYTTTAPPPSEVFHEGSQQKHNHGAEQNLSQCANTSNMLVVSPSGCICTCIIIGICVCKHTHNIHEHIHVHIHIKI